MKAKRVYEFVQSKDIKAEIGINVLQRKSIAEWFDIFAPGIEYAIDENDFMVDVHSSIDLQYSFITEFPDFIKSIDGYLDLEQTQITNLGNLSKVSSWIALGESQLQILPDNLCNLV